MKRKIHKLVQSKIQILILLVAISFAAPFLKTAQPAFACDLYTKTPVTEVIVPWYKYLEGVDAGGKCRPDLSASELKSGKTVSLVAMAIIELITRIGGLIAAGYIIYGAFQYITSQGEPEGLKGAKDTINNALVGFVIVLLATVIVQFLARTIK
jgi:hypothetical protein